MIGLLNALLLVIIAMVLVYATRHYLFTLVRMFLPANDLYCDLDDAQWPTVTVQIPAHNEEDVIGHCLDSLLAAAYPPGRLLLMPVNDRSDDRTGEIIDRYAAEHPGCVVPFHRAAGKPGKAAALKDALEHVDSEILIVFDADYTPSRTLIKRLVAPFFDPEIGAVMGRVVPLNAGTNLLTRLLEIERSGGYQVDQQARMQLGLVPQYGGTTGGVRVSALKEIGGWHDDTLAEDTDLTYRLLLAGWKTAYQNRAECYEEVPETWRMRMRQIQRWAKGHNQVLWRHLFALMRSRRVSFREKLDGVFLLGVYLVAPVLAIGWILVIVLFYLGQTLFAEAVFLTLCIFVYGSLGNFAAFFELAAASHLDRRRDNARLLPLVMLSFVVSMVAVTRAICSAGLDWLSRRELVWHKTARFRR